MKLAAVFTMTKTADAMLSVWLRYYRQWFEPQDIYILDHDTTGDHQAVLAKLAKEQPYRIIPVSHPYAYDTTWMARTASDFQRFLLQSYRTVVFAAVDEIIMTALPLHEYLSRADSPAIERCAGFEVVQFPDQEGNIDFTKPVLGQRRFWYPCERYSKCAVGRVPISWQRGFADVYNQGHYPQREQLQLLHLHKVDFQYALKRHGFMSAQRWWPGDRFQGPSRHNLIDEAPMLRRWMACHADDTSKVSTLQQIPDEVRGRYPI